MQNEQRARVTDAERRSFSDKLQQFSATLSPGEQAILGNSSDWPG